MFDKLLHFIKYNNATIIIMAIILILGASALAAGPEAIGQKQTSVEGIDNILLLSADLDNFNMDFKIANIEQDDNYYYVTYSYLDLVVIDNAWQYQLNFQTHKISKKLKQDLGQYLAGWLAKHHEARVRQLQQEKHLAELSGARTRTEVTEYSGLVGRTLDLAAKVFPGYEPVVKRELPSPEALTLPSPAPGVAGEGITPADNLAQVYNDYVAAHPDLFVETATSSPDTEAEAETATAETVASSTPGLAPETAPAETTPIQEPAEVQIIELPPTEPAAPIETAPVPEPAPDETAPVD